MDFVGIDANDRTWLNFLVPLVDLLNNFPYKTMKGLMLVTVFFMKPSNLPYVHSTLNDIEIELVNI